MWRSKKVIVGVVLAAVLLAGSIGGVALAQSGNGDEGQSKMLLARVAEKLGINQQELEDAFIAARTEMQNEALDNYLEDLVSQDKITQEQADQYKAWLQSRPDMTQYNQQLRDWQQARPGIPPELNDWQQSRPDAPLPGQFGRFGGHGGFRGMGGMRGFGGLCAPAE